MMHVAPKSLCSLALAGLCLACSPALLEDQGAALAASTTGLSPSTANIYACLTCHAETVDEAPGHLLPGAPLAGATTRTSFWSGQENDLLESINACRAAFMGASTPLEADSSEGQALYAYLLSLEPGDPGPIPFTVQRTIVDLPRGSGDRGLELYDEACAGCHGAPHSGDDRLDDRVPILPEDTVTSHLELGYSYRLIRLVFIEKVRHGPFLGYGGDMPPLSLEVLNDEGLADILEALGVTGENP
jgi:thiosulfate dehydrogenase